MKWYPQLCKISVCNDENRHLMTIITSEQLCKIGQIITNDSMLFTLSSVSKFPFKVTKSNVRPYLTDWTYYEDIIDYHDVFNFEHRDAFKIALKKVYPDVESLYVHHFQEVFF